MKYLIPLLLILVACGGNDDPKPSKSSFKGRWELVNPSAYGLNYLRFSINEDQIPYDAEVEVPGHTNFDTDEKYTIQGDIYQLFFKGYPFRIEINEDVNLDESGNLIGTRMNVHIQPPATESEKLYYNVKFRRI